jgi:hypothetical protein
MNPMEQGPKHARKKIWIHTENGSNLARRQCPGLKLKQHDENWICSIEADASGRFVHALLPSKNNKTACGIRPFRPTAENPGDGNPTTPKSVPPQPAALDPLGQAARWFPGNEPVVDLAIAACVPVPKGIKPEKHS